MTDAERFEALCQEKLKQYEDPDTALYHAEMEFNEGGGYGLQK